MRSKASKLACDPGVEQTGDRSVAQQEGGLLLHFPIDQRRDLVARGWR
jgi:hypothetical protein